MSEPLKLPELPFCPYHKENPPKAIADCRICWTRFYISMENEPILARINARITEYNAWVERAERYIELQNMGYNTKTRPPKSTLVTFALPDGKFVKGREIDDMMGGTYPVKDDEDMTPINSYLGWSIN